MSAAIYGKRAGLNLLIIEKNPMGGGQVLNTYEVDNYLGLPGINGFDMGMTFQNHAKNQGCQFVTATVNELKLQGEVKEVVTNKGAFEAKTVILALGAHHATLNVPGEETFAGKGVSYCATCDGAFYRGKKVAVVGGGDVAVEDAIYLARFCEKVYLIHRRDALRAAKALQDKLFALENVEVIWNHVVEEICGEESVKSLTLRSTAEGTEQKLQVEGCTDQEQQTDGTNQEQKLQADLSPNEDGTTKLFLDGVFVAVGIHPDTDMVLEQVKCNPAGYVIAGEDCKTSLEGVYVAGDARQKPLRQIITAVSDGANAATHASLYLMK